MSRSPQQNANDAALRRLRAEYPKRFRELIDEERERLGLKPLIPRKKARIEQMHDEIARLEQEVS